MRSSLCFKISKEKGDYFFVIVTSPVSPSISTQSPVLIIEKTSTSLKSATAGTSSAAVATPQRLSMLENTQPAGEKPATAAEWKWPVRGTATAGGLCQNVDREATRAHPG